MHLFTYTCTLVHTRTHIIHTNAYRDVYVHMYFDKMRRQSCNPHLPLLSSPPPSPSHQSLPPLFFIFPFLIIRFDSIQFNSIQFLSFSSNPSLSLIPFPSLPFSSYSPPPFLLPYPSPFSLPHLSH